MKAYLIAVLSILVLLPFHSQATEGLINKPSKHSVTVTLDRLENILKKKGITIVTRWSHDAGANKAGIVLRPTELLIFGNPKMGSHLMTGNQTTGLDLPMKALAWQDANGKVWLSYNDPEYVVKRHGVDDRQDVVNKMAAALDKMTTAATQ